MREIIPLIYPAIFSHHIYPEIRDKAVQEAMMLCRIKAREDSNMRDIKSRVIQTMSEMILKETISQLMNYTRDTIVKKEKERE